MSQGGEDCQLECHGKHNEFYLPNQMYQLSINMPQAQATSQAIPNTMTKTSNQVKQVLRKSIRFKTMPKNDSPCHYQLSMKIIDQESWWAILHVVGFACISSLVTFFKKTNDYQSNLHKTMSCCLLQAPWFNFTIVLYKERDT